jgi:CheY-like chemotaxis protein
MCDLVHSRKLSHKVSLRSVLHGSEEEQAAGSAELRCRDALASEREKALAVGCEEFDTKPVEFDRLLGKLRKLVSARMA